MRETPTSRSPTELFLGLFDLRTRQLIAVRRDPTSHDLQLSDTPFDQVFLYAFGCESHRRLTVRGPGTKLREFGVEPSHEAFWAAYVREIAPMSLSDPGRPSGYTSPKWPMPWIEWRPEMSALATGPTKVDAATERVS